MFSLLISSIIQGITEFLPISSSAHLLIWEHFQHQPIAYLMVLNAGTLLSTIIYFRRELLYMIIDFIKQLSGKGSTQYSRLAWLLIVSTIPVCIVGFLLKDMIENHLRSIVIMGAMMIIFGALLGLSDRQERKYSDYRSITFMQALLIGLAQICSLIPGASRSGVTITAARFLGLNLQLSVRYSFLLAIPVTLGAVVLSCIQTWKHPITWVWSDVLLGFAVSAATGLLCIHFLLKLITRIGLFPFAVYRIILGAGLILYFW